MEIFINDFSFGLFFWQLINLVVFLPVLIWCIVLLAKDQQETFGNKILVFICFFIFPLFSWIFYLMHYYNKRKKQQAL